jgi:two-component system chemotaxis response regulator CheY
MTAKDAESISVSTGARQADVLVVDDEADVRRSMCEVLRTSGFSVNEAEDGAVAFGMLRDNRYGMVLLDIRMPKLDGVSLIEALVEPPPVIVHSAFTLSAEERQRLGVKVVQYLHKPVSPQELLSAVRGVLDSASDA